MDEPYTHTTWHVRPDQQDAFVERWRNWVEWSHRAGFRARATLLRDVEHPETFVSFGPWESLDAVRNWRGAPGYQDRVNSLLEVVESWEPRTLERVAEG
jgi:heme-degrading monooxygenase HmoA